MRKLGVSQVEVVEEEFVEELRILNTFTKENYELRLSKGIQYAVEIENKEDESIIILNRCYSYGCAKTFFVKMVTKLMNVNEYRIFQEFWITPIVEGLCKNIPAYKNSEWFKHTLTQQIFYKCHNGNGTIQMLPKEDNLSEKGLKAYNQMREHVDLNKYKDIDFKQYANDERVYEDIETEVFEFTHTDAFRSLRFFER